QPQRGEARHDGPARFQDRLDEVDSAETGADAGQFGADPLTLIAEAVALETERLFRIEEDLPAAFGVARLGERGLRQRFVSRGSALAAERQAEIRADRWADPKVDAIRPGGEFAGKAGDRVAIGGSLRSAVEWLAVEPNFCGGGAGKSELDGRRGANGEFGLG